MAIQAQSGDQTQSTDRSEKSINGEVGDESSSIRKRFERYIEKLKTDKEYSRQAMKLVDTSGPEPVTKVRRTKSFQINVGKDKNRQMIVFTAPSTVEGTTLLSWTYPDADADQWIYLPEIGSIERIVTSGQGEYFMGTDFTYADLRPDDPARFRYERLKDSVDCRQWTCTKVAIHPKTDKTEKQTGYSKRIVLMRDDVNVPVRITHYDRDGELLKRLRLFEFDEVKPGNHRPMKQAMVHKQRDHRTLISVNEWTDDVDFDATLFTKTSVKQERPLDYTP